MSGRRSERHRRAISDPQCRESCFYSMKLGTYIFLHLNIRNTHVFITSQHFQHLLYTVFFYSHQLYHLITHNSSFNNRLFHFFRSPSNAHPHLLKYLTAFRI